MRLTCPNCKAQYEVDERVIPDGGRDVQCSSCGSTWFQYPAEVALRMRAADLDDDDDDDDDDAAPSVPRRPVAAAGTERRVDRTVLDVLREEAERELSERRKAAPAPVETQTELGLVSRPTARGAKPDAQKSSAPTPVQPSVAAEPAQDVPRRNLLPDIEELTSTLEPGRHAGKRDEMMDPDETQVSAGRGRDFRRGLSAILLVATILTALYVLAPTLAGYVPALAGPLAGYVVMIDTLRQVVAGLFGG